MILSKAEVALLKKNSSAQIQAFAESHEKLRLLVEKNQYASGDYAAAYRCRECEYEDGTGHANDCETGEALK